MLLLQLAVAYVSFPKVQLDIARLFWKILQDVV